MEEAIAVDIITGKIPSREKEATRQLYVKRFAMVAALYQRNSAPYQKAAVWLALYPTEAFFAVGLTSTDIDDYFYLKSILEVQMYKMGNRKNRQGAHGLLEALLTLCSSIPRATFDLPKILRINDGFDAIIYNASQNKEIEKSVLPDAQLHPQTCYCRCYLSLNYLPTGLEEHRAIFEAFKPKDRRPGASCPNTHVQDHAPPQKPRGSSGLGAWTAGEARTLSVWLKARPGAQAGIFVPIMMR